MAFADYWQRAGLRFINSIARSVPVDRQTLTFGTDERQRLDWYRHRVVNSSRPTVVFFYGGGWESGHRQDYRFVADTLMTMGFNVVIPDYRLFPSVRFDDILKDAQGALSIVLDQIDQGSSLFLIGHSAGAQIAALLTLDKDLNPQHDRIKGFVGLAGPYDFFPFTDDAHWDLFGPEERYPLSQPVNFVRSDAPPLYLLHGEEDRRVRRGHSKSLMEKQVAAGGVANREIYAGMGHVDIILEFSRLHRVRSKLIADIYRFLRERV